MTKTTKKVCVTCRIEKPLSEYYRKAPSADGLQSPCKVCQRKASSKWHGGRTCGPKPVRIVSETDPELIIDLPGIYEVQNRGRGYTSFRFESPIDGSVFSYSSFKDARRARQSMMTALKQLAAYDSTHRQSVAIRRVAAEATEDDFE